MKFINYLLLLLVLGFFQLSGKPSQKEFELLSTEDKVHYINSLSLSDRFIFFISHKFYEATPTITLKFIENGQLIVYEYGVGSNTLFWKYDMNKLTIYTNQKNNNKYNKTIISIIGEWNEIRAEEWGDIIFYLENNKTSPPKNLCLRLNI